MDKVNPADYLSGTLGAMAPNLDDPNCPYRNPFNPDKTLEFYECEMVQRPDDPAIPAKPEAVLNPGAIPSAQSLGISDPPPDYKQPVFNPKSTAIHPIFKAPDVPPMPEPRNSLTPDDPEKVLQALPDYTLHTIDSIPTLDDIPPFSGPQYTIGRPEHPQAKAFAWPKIVLSQERIEWLSFRDLDALHHISSVPPTEDVSKKLSEQNIVLKQALLEVLMNPSYAGWREDTRLHEALEQAFRSTAMGIAIDGKSALESEYFKAIFSRLNNGDDGTTKPLPDLDDPAWHVLQFLKTIEGYSQSDLYLRPEWLEQFQALLEADCDVPYTVGNSLLAAALKTVDGTSVISETLGVKDTDDVFHSLTDKVDEIKWSYEDSANPDNLKIYSANHSVTYVEDDEKYIEVPNPRLRYDETGQLQADGTYVLGNDRALHLVSDNLYFKAKRDGFTAINPEERFDYIDQKTPLFVLNRGEFAQVANAIRQYVCKNNVYYTVLGTTDGTSPQYILSDGSNVDASDYELFYRARIGEGDSLSYVYGARLYEWQEETEYILQSQCRANVHYEDYQRWSEESTGFTRTDDILYTKNALGEYTPISDVQKLYIATTVAGTSPNESTTNYLRIEFPGRFYLQDGDKYLYVPDPSLRYTSAGVLSATGTYVRTEEEGYFDPSKLTETQKKRFIQLYDSTYRKDGDTYVVAANGSYVYGQLTSYKYAEVDSGGKLKRYVKHEGNFSSSADDVYKLFSDVMVKGDDDHFYPYNEIYLRGLQSVSCPEEELLVSLENDETGPAFQMVVPSLPQQYTTLTTLAADKTALVTDLQAVETYFQRVKTNLATFTRQVDAFRNADEELEQLTHFYNTEPIDWSDAGHVEGVANQILQQLSGIRGRHGSIWRQYAEFIIETLKTYNPSEDSSIIFLDRCRQIDVALERVSKANGFTDEDGHALLTTHTDFFGKSLAEVFFQCQESARPETEEEFLRLFKLTQALTKEFNDLVVGWEAIDAKRYISQMLVTQRRQLQSAVNKLQALDWVNFRSLVAQKEFFEKATLLEHVFGNYGELSDDLIFSPAEVDMRIVQQSSLPNGSIYYRSVDGTFHPKDSIHAYVNTTYNIVTLSNFATVQRYDGNGRTNDEGLYIKINGQLALLDTYELNTHGGLTPITFFDGNNFAATSRFALNTTYTAYTSGSLDGYDYVVSGSTYYDRTQSGTFYLSTDGGVTKIPLQSLAFYQENPNATTYIRSDSGDYLRTDEGHYVERSEFSSFFEVAASSISTNGQLTRYRLTGDYYTADNSGEFVLIDGIFYRRNASNTVIQGAHYGSSEITRYSLENSYQSAINGPVICVSGEYRNIAGATFYFQPEGSSAFITVEAGANRYELNYTENASGTYVVETKDDGTEVGYLRNEVNLQVYAVQQGGNYVIIEHPEVSYQKSYFPKNSSGSSGEEDLYVADASGILYRHMSNNSFAEKSAVKWYFPNTSGTGYVEAPVDHDSQNSHILKEDTQVYEMEYVSDNTGGAYYKASDDNYYETDNVTAYYVDSDDGNKLFFVEHPEDISSDTVTIQKQYTVSYFLESDTTQSSPIDVSKRYKKNDDDDYKEDNDGTYIKTGTGTSDADFTLLSDLKAYYTNSSGTLTPISDTNFINGSETFTQDFTFNVTYCVRDTVTSGTSTSSSEDVVTVSDISQKYNYTQVLTETQPPADLWNNTDAYYVKIGNAYYLLSNLQEGSLSGNTLTGTADTTDYVHGYCQTTEVDDDFPDTSDVVEYKRGADSVFYVPTSLRRGFEKDSSIIIVETNADNTPKRYTQNHAVSDDGAYIKGNNGRFYTMVGNSFHYGTQEGPTVYLDQRFALSYRYIQSAMGNLIGVAGTENLLKIASEKRGARVGSTWEQITETTKFYERQGGFLEVGSTGAIPANAYIIDTEGLYHLARSCRFYANQEEISSFRPYRKTDTYSTTDNGSYLRKQDGTYFSRAHVLLGAALDYKGIQIEDADTRYNVSGGSGSPDPNGRYFRTVDGDFIEADTLKYYDGDSGAHIADTENQYFEISAGSQQYALFSTGATYLWFEGELDQLRLCTTNSTTGTYYYRYDTHTGQIQESPNGEHWIDIDFTEVAARWNAAAKYFKDAIRKERITDAFRYAEKSILTPLSAEEFQNVSPRHPIHQFLTSIQQYLATSLYQ
ncbi:MAG: hypothetical protein LBD40_01540, partial [Puniceicoccales bacterium]|nr:hypothetical protein [Puniceicoccales bacterium]